MFRNSDRTLRDRPEVDGFESEFVEEAGYSDQGSNFYDTDAQMESSLSEASDLESSVEREPRFQVRRTNIHDMGARPQRDAQDERNQMRAARLARRNQVRSPDEEEQEDDGQRQTRGRLHRNNTRRPVAGQSDGRRNEMSSGQQSR